ncbi:MAG: biotin transporter BioY [Clostridia bacterium]|nr:biotin transporter BioY [Clostridia bacterium]
MQQSTSIRNFCLSALMCALLVTSTLLLRFPLPGTDVLFTTQLIFVLLSGLVLPTPYGLYAVLGYIFLGLMGIPVFSSVSGLAVIATPSFGFLLGFPCAVLVSSFVRQLLAQKKSCDLLAALAGTFIMYVVALGYIALLNGIWLRAPIGVTELLATYCAWFLPLDIVKAALAAMIAPRLRKAIRL